ncbi:MAG TPA: hypothetical protein VKT72_11705 [Candidatus Baltobacteraceae bacterium]|nr:hypothetical protein [Candidatus Baltobacteraceae bacterium]
MRSIQAVLALGAVVVGVALFGVAESSAAVQDITTGTCPRLTATPYVIAGTAMGGSHYVVMVANVSCAQAAPWIKKIVAQHLSGPADEDMTVKGPAGYSCRASLDGRGHPYQGRCEKNGAKDTAFQWVMGG